MIFAKHALNKFVNLPTKVAASSVKRCGWTVYGRKYLANKSYVAKKLILIGERSI